MLSSPHCAVVTLEEHYWDEELASRYSGPDAATSADMRRRLLDLQEIRLADMDAAGIDLQVISHAPPATQKLSGKEAVALTQRVNDRLAAVVSANPMRFAAFAALPTSNPMAAAEELERCVLERGFSGAMIHGLAEGRFVDGRRYWPIFAKAEALDVPIYIHPAVPHSSVVEVYYGAYMDEFPMFARAAWGYTVEAATQAIRLILSGVFDAHPKLKIILGHFGEGLPFLLWRIDSALARPGQRSVHFGDVFRKNFWVTTSGFFSNSALVCSMMELGIDRILFSVDYPYVPNDAGTKWLANTSLSDEDKIKLAGTNAKLLLRL